MKQVHREPIYGLDFVRFFSAIFVIFYHFGFKEWMTPDDPGVRLAANAPVTPSLWAISWWGWIGVQLFFVISGLVISYSVDGNSASDFARKRALRLIPTVLICATFAFVVEIILGYKDLHRIIIEYIHVICFLPMRPWIMGQFWTLPIEIAFYALVWLMICVRIGKHLEPLAWVLASISALYFLLVDGLGLHDPNGRVSALLLLQHGGLFALGIILTKTETDGYRLRHIPIATGCVVLAALQIQDAAAGEHLSFGLSKLWLIPFGIWLTGVGAILASLHWKSWLARKLSPYSAKIRLLGLMTFPLYLIHIHSGGLILLYLEKIRAPNYVTVLSAVVVSLITALIVVRWIEPPVKTLLAKVISGK